MLFIVVTRIISQGVALLHKSQNPSHPHSFNVLKWMRLSEGLTWQEIVFITVGGLRGGLSLVLAQAVAAGQVESGLSDEQRVRRDSFLQAAPLAL